MTASDLKSKVSATKDAAKDVASAAVDLAKDAASKAKAEASSIAGDAAETLRESASDNYDAARETLANTGDRLARTLHDTAENVRGIGSHAISGAAEGLTSAARSLRSHSLEDIFVATKDFAKRNPGAFAAGAAVAGFALARFLRSSARAEAAEDRAQARTDRLYRDAAKRSVDTMGRS